MKYFVVFVPLICVLASAQPQCVDSYRSSYGQFTSAIKTTSAMMLPGETMKYIPLCQPGECATGISITVCADDMQRNLKVIYMNGQLVATRPIAPSKIVLSIVYDTNPASPYQCITDGTVLINPTNKIKQ